MLQLKEQGPTAAVLQDISLRSKLQNIALYGRSGPFRGTGSAVNDHSFVNSQPGRGVKPSPTKKVTKESLGKWDENT